MLRSHPRTTMAVVAAALPRLWLCLAPPGLQGIYTRLGSWVYLLGYSCIASKKHWLNTCEMVTLCQFDRSKQVCNTVGMLSDKFGCLFTSGVQDLQCFSSIVIDHCIYIYTYVYIYIYNYNFCDLASRIQQLWLFCWWWPCRFKILLQ